MLSLPAREVLGFWPAALSQPFLQSLDQSLSPWTFSTQCAHTIGFLFRMVPWGGFPLTSVLRTWPRATTPARSHAAGSGPSSLTWAHSHQPRSSLPAQPSWHFRFSPLISRLRRFVGFSGRYSGAHEPSPIPPALRFPSLRALQDLPAPLGRGRAGSISAPPGRVIAALSPTQACVTKMVLGAGRAQGARGHAHRSDHSPPGRHRFPAWSSDSGVLG